MSAKYFDWDEKKNQWLQSERQVSFEIVILAIEGSGLLDILRNKKPKDHQILYIVLVDNYVYVVPAVEETKHIFLKTIYPSRKMYKHYLKN